MFEADDTDSLRTFVIKTSNARAKPRSSPDVLGDDYLSCLVACGCHACAGMRFCTAASCRNCKNKQRNSSPGTRDDLDDLHHNPRVAGRMSSPEAVEVDAERIAADWQRRGVQYCPPC